jgi:hypothetical protein
VNAARRARLTGKRTASNRPKAEKVGESYSASAAPPLVLRWRDSRSRHDVLAARVLAKCSFDPTDQPSSVPKRAIAAHRSPNTLKHDMITKTAYFDG